MAHVVDSEPQKRKREVDDADGQPGRPQHAHTPLHQGFIQYLPKLPNSHLNLIQGDGDTFSEVIGLIGEYESVIDRHESLAANLGAKLTGPRLLRGVEKFFDGPIKTAPIQPFTNPISWLDVIIFARSNPKEHTIAHKADGSRWCQFVFNGAQVEITEDDWRLIWSGALDRFPLDQPLEEDEAAELATLDILEQRTSILYKKADEVAARARILNHRLGQRKQEIRHRRSAQDRASPRFKSGNQNQLGGNFGLSYDLHADLLQQFIAASTAPLPSRSTSGAGLSLASGGQRSPSHSTYVGPVSASRYSAGNSTDPMCQPVSDSRVDAFRALITQRIDQLGKGDEISPPCDRCRRLKVPCVKHLTACVGCTKKHAKCSWKTVTDEEVGKLGQEMHMKSDDGMNAEGEMGSDVSEARDHQGSRLEDRRETSRRSGERSPSATLAVLRDGGSRSPSRDGVLLATLEPPISVSMNRFDLSVERHRLGRGAGLPAGGDRDHADRTPDVSHPAHSTSVMTVSSAMTSTTSTTGPPSNDGSSTASPR